MVSEKEIDLKYTKDEQKLISDRIEKCAKDITEFSKRMGYSMPEFLSAIILLHASAIKYAEIKGAKDIKGLSDELVNASLKVKTRLESRLKK